MKINCASLTLFLSSAYIHLGRNSAHALPPKPHELNKSYNFANYVSDFEKPYIEGTQEWEIREQIFHDNLEEILSHNEFLGANTAVEENMEKKSPSYVKGVNKFTDQTPSEIVKGYDKSQHPAYRSSSITSSKRKLNYQDLPFEVEEISELPLTVDWRTKGVVSPVKDQGACGSCWAFASTEVVESNVAIETGSLLELSPQQLVDCTPNLQHCGGGGGCSGATVELAFDYVIGTGGMVLDGTIAYTASDDVCPLENQESETFSLRGSESMDVDKVAAIKDYVTLPTNDYKAVMNAIAKTGPVAVAVDASKWYLYDSGVFTGDGTFGFDIDHAVVLVGYGTDEESGLDYWLVRNSWGPYWGEDGYIRMKRDGKNIECAMDITPFDGSGCQLDVHGNNILPDPVEVCGIDGILFDVVVPMGGYLVN